MNKAKRLDLFIEKHIGLGIRWRSWGQHRFEISIAILCFTLSIGLGEQQ